MSRLRIALLVACTGALLATFALTAMRLPDHGLVVAVVTVTPVPTASAVRTVTPTRVPQTPAGSLPRATATPLAFATPTPDSAPILPEAVTLTREPQLASSRDFYVVSAGGGPARLLHRSTGWTGALWAPSGTLLAFLDSSSVRLVDVFAPSEPKTLGVYPHAGTVPKAAWRPDGQALALEIDRTIHVADVMGDVRLLTSLGNPVSSMRWSPNGDALAMVTERTLPSLQPILRMESEGAVFVVGTGPTPFAREVMRTVGTSGTALEVLAWAPDGLSLLVRHGQRLVVVATSDGVATQIAESSLSHVSPSETLVAYAERLDVPPCTAYLGGPVAIQVLNWVTGERSTPVPSVCGLALVAWSPDSRQLAYSAVGGDAPGTYVVSVARPAPRKVTDETGCGVLSWVPRGGALLARFAHCAAGDPGRLFFIPLSGGAPTRIGSPSAGLAPTFSFGGFDRSGQRYAIADESLRVESIGGPSRTLSPATPGARYVAGNWSPDGEWVTFQRDPDEAVRHYTADIVSGTLTETMGEPACASFSMDRSAPSPDGTLRAALELETSHIGDMRGARQYTRLVVGPPDGSATRLLLDGRSTTFVSPVWSPDSRFIALLGHDRSSMPQRPVIVVVSAATGHRHDMGEVHAGQVQRLLWSPDSARLAVHLHAAAGEGLYVAQFGQAELRPAAYSAAITCVAWMADSTTLHFSTAMFRGGL